MNIDVLCDITGLTYCDDECPCGDANHLLWLMPGADDDAPGWLPAWANGVGPEELWNWMIKQTDERVVAAVREVTK